MPKISTFDISQYLESEEMIAEYLSQVLKDGNTDLSNILYVIAKFFQLTYKSVY